MELFVACPLFQHNPREIVQSMSGQNTQSMRVKRSDYVFFAPPSMRNRQSEFSAISHGFPPDSRRLSIHFDRFSVIFNQFPSASVNFNQFDLFKNAGID